MSQQRDFRRYSNPQQAAGDMAAESVGFLKKRLTSEGRASVVLTGGSSPHELYARWAADHRDAIDWSRVHFFWGDERNVPMGDADSNTTASRELLDHLPVDRDKLHVWQTEREPEEALSAMRDTLADTACTGGEFGFDLVLLGVGPDGHVASLFPADQPWVALGDEAPDDVKFISDSPKPPAERYTFTLPMLNRSRWVYLLPFGKTKAEVVKQLKDGDPSIPASHVHGRECTVVWTDQG